MQAHTLAGVAVALAQSGQHERATDIVSHAEHTARSITDLHAQANALAGVAVASAQAGQHQRWLLAVDGSEQGRP